MCARTSSVLADSLCSAKFSPPCVFAVRGLRRSRLTVRVQLSSAHHVFLLCRRSRLTVRVQLSSAHHVFLLCADFVSLGLTVRVQLNRAHHVFLLCADFVGLG